MKNILFSIIFTLFSFGAFAGGFVHVKNKSFEVGGKPYYFIGTNFWYGAILGSNGEGGNRERLVKELDLLSSKGINNLRILVGADGLNGVRTKVEPTLQVTPGVYNDTILEGLDFLISEMGKRKMHAVLYLNNSWEWSGGYSQYLNWAGSGPIPIPAVDGWPAYTTYVSGFATNTKAIEIFKDHVKFIVSRTNRFTGKRYIDDEAIMSWQVGNEPRAFGKNNIKAFVGWMSEVTALIRSLDHNHLISTGSEGSKGSEDDLSLWEKIHSDYNIDYMNIHVWPYNWRWIDKTNIPATTPGAIANALEYINKHASIASKYGKPLVLEEFGLPRDNMRFTIENQTKSRDAFYKSIFECILHDAQTGGCFAGCNFWGWGGYARPNTEHIFWQKGDDYMGDPAQEEQGLNSVYNCDPTVDLVDDYNRRIDIAVNKYFPIDRKATSETVALYQNMKKYASQKVMFGQQDATLYGIGWKYDMNRSDVKSVCGDYPAVYGWELGDIELGKDVSLDSIHFTKIREHIQDAYRRGGVNTISWHVNNPVTGKNAWDNEPIGAVQSVLPDGVNHAKMLTWLNKVADFMKSLKGDHGELIPVVFRPWHELTGDWFWWGNKQCTTDEYIHLWQMTVSYLRDSCNVHNLLFNYSPNQVKTSSEYLERYPGDDWVDFMGFDSYQGTKETNKVYIEKVRASLEVVSTLADESNKVTVLSEAGYNLVPYEKWWTKVLLEAVNGYPVSYVLVWRNAYERPNHFFGPYPNQLSSKDFVRFSKNAKVLLESKLPNMYK